MTRYVMKGRPLGAPFQVLIDHTVGDEFEADLDEATEKLLLGAGALAVIPDAPRSKKDEESKSEPKAEEKPEPKAEATSEPKASSEKSGR